jgi:hypothetical protein
MSRERLKAVSDETLRIVVLSLLGTGGATFIWTVIKSVIALRNSAEGREDKAIGRLEKFEEDCRAQLVTERRWGLFWYRRASQFERLLTLNGVDIPPPSSPEPERNVL